MTNSAENRTPRLIVALLLLSLVSGGCLTVAVEKKQSGLEDKDRHSNALKWFNSQKKVTVPNSPHNAHLGKSPALLEIHIFADFWCPHCRSTSHILKEAMERWPGKIKVNYIYFPLDSECNPLISNPRPGSTPCLTALAAICGGQQGIFPELAHRLYTLPDYPISEFSVKLRTFVGDSQGDWRKMEQCMDSPSATRDLAVDVQTATSMGINALPTIVIQGRMLPRGSPNRDYFFILLESLLLEAEKSITGIIESERS